MPNNIKKHNIKTMKKIIETNGCHCIYDNVYCTCSGCYLRDYLIKENKIEPEDKFIAHMCNLYIDHGLAVKLAKEYLKYHATPEEIMEELL